jgi:hypothetical protein
MKDMAKEKHSSDSCSIRSFKVDQTFRLFRFSKKISTIYNIL